jgi:membrane associated rhomboid family serine protease
MGLHSRDYARDSYGDGRFFSTSGGGVVKKIIIATIGVFFLQLLTESPVSTGLTGWLAVDFPKVTSQGQVWRLLTYAFCHSTRDVWHIVFNLYLLWILGREVESLYGSKEFTWFYMVSAVFAAVCYLIVGMLSDDTFGTMLGASGAISAVTMAYALHYPRRKIYIWGIIGIEMRWLMALLIVKDAYPVIGELMGRSASGNVAHACHLGGVLFGWIYFKRQLRLSSLVNGVGLGAFRKEQKIRKSKLKIFNPPAPKTPTPQPKASVGVSGEQVDAILAKISDQGEQSLTDRERAILKEASKQYRGNR